MARKEGNLAEHDRQIFTWSQAPRAPVRVRDVLPRRGGALTRRRDHG